MRRKRFPHDNRLDWRDPNMPALRYGKVNDIEGLHEIEPDVITKYYEAKLEQLGWQMPDWSVDETYDLVSRHNRKGRDK